MRNRQNQDLLREERNHFPLKIIGNFKLIYLKRFEVKLGRNYEIPN
jgi:hypothetical protein